MSKTHYRVIALVLPVALLGLIIFAPAAAAKKSKKKKQVEASVYRPPTIQLTASPTVLTACAGEAARVQLDARVSFESGATPKYRWKTSGGKIDSDGPTPNWDLSGVQPGYYKAYLEVDNGVTEECVAFSSATVLVKCAPPVCPNIQISCPDKVEIDQPVTFSVNVSGGSPNGAHVYEWTVSAGKIISGEGTNTITVDTKGLAGQSVRATLAMPGYSDLNCSASCVVQIPNELPKCRKFDEYFNITRNDEKARLDNFGIELQNDPASTAYVVVYPGRNGKPGEVQQRATRVVDYLANSRGIDKRRIVVIVGPARDELAVELWVCPEGAKAPAPGGMN
jgi:PKD-like domain